MTFCRGSQRAEAISHGGKQGTRRLAPWFSKRGPQPSRTTIPGELTHAKPFLTHGSEKNQTTRGWGPALGFVIPVGDSGALVKQRATDVICSLLLLSGEGSFPGARPGRSPEDLGLTPLRAASWERAGAGHEAQHREHSPGGCDRAASRRGLHSR